MTKKTLRRQLEEIKTRLEKSLEILNEERKNILEALEIVDRSIEEDREKNFARERMIKEEKLYGALLQPINTLNFNDCKRRRLIDLLEGEKIGYLVQCTEAQLLSIKGFGRKTVNSIKKQLEIQYGLHLGMTLHFFPEKVPKELLKNPNP